MDVQNSCQLLRTFRDLLLVDADLLVHELVVGFILDLADDARSLMHFGTSREVLNL